MSAVPRVGTSTAHSTQHASRQVAPASSQIQPLVHAVSSDAVLAVKNGNLNTQITTFLHAGASVAWIASWLALISQYVRNTAGLWHKASMQICCHKA